MTNRRSFLIASSALLASTALPAFAGGHGRVGEFTGASNHVTKVRAEVFTKYGQTEIILQVDYRFVGAPVSKVALGRNGDDATTLMGKLSKNAGMHSYIVPAGIDASQYNEVWIWCEKFNVPLGVAKLN